MKKKEKERLQESILEHVRKDFSALKNNLTVGEALDVIREKGIGEKIVYFYVIDEKEQLVGVLPTRRLLTSPLEKKLESIMINKVATIPHTATVYDACEFFALNRFLAVPVVDDDLHILGIIDINIFTEQIFDITEREQMDEVFEAIGFKVSQVRDASPFRAFRYRFPWLMATIIGGTACAILASMYHLTLAKTLVLAFFLTLVLGLGESVSIQSMTITIQALRLTRPTLRWYVASFRREVGTSLLLGIGCGIMVGLIVWLWRGEGLAGFVIGSSIALSLCSAAFLGLSIPAVLHSLRLDPKVAAGPLTLALADMMTVVIYLSMATWIL